MRTFCTIITSNYFAYAVTLYRSLIQYKNDEKLVVLICDDGDLRPNSTFFPGIVILRLKDIFAYKDTSLLYHKYSEQNLDAFRWSMKSVLLRYLLEREYEKVIYIDSDIFFFNSYEFLFEELDKSCILLTPSWRTINPEKNEEEFVHLYTDGLYNAGFLAANRQGLKALGWWTKVCLYRMSIDREQGIYDDQKYLDAMPLMFEKVKSLNHRGINIAFWNQFECRRTLCDGKLMINNEVPIVFVHFTNKYIQELYDGNDHLIFPLLQEYEKTFAESGFQLRHFVTNLPTYNPPGTFKKVKRKLLLRTKFKNLMYRIIDKI